MTADFQRRRREDGQGFYCPAGHRQSYTESTVQQLQKELKRKEEVLQREREWNESLRKSRDAAHRSAAAYKGKVTRIKNRIHNGVCPCCNRHFENLQRHMKNKHPEFVRAEPEEGR